MINVKNILLVLLSVLSLLAWGFAIYWVFRAVDFGFLQGLFVGLVPSVVTWILQRQSIKHEHQRWLMSDKKAYLVEVVHIFSSMLADKRKKKTTNMEELVKKFESLRPALVVWGAPPTIRAWEEIQKTPDNLDEMHRKLERFFRAIRKEAGCDDSGLEPGEVTCIFLREEEKSAVLNACKGETYP